MSVIRSFSEADIARVLTFEELIPAMERALAAFSAGEVIQPVRSVLTLEPGQRYLGVMPAATQEAMGAKLVSFYPKNAGTEVPTHMASIALFDSATGRPLAFLDGRLITEMRTAAVSAAVTRHLAPGEAKVLALIGSGVQARAHLAALRHVRRFEEVRVWSPTPAHAQRFAADTGARALDAQAAVRGADVIVVATTMTSAPRTAASASSARAPVSAAKRCACAGVGLQTRTSSKRRTCRRASRWARACTPLPMSASTFASPGARWRVTAAETAAVRISVMRRPSRKASGRPVADSNSAMLAMCVGTSVPAFFG